MTPTPEEYAQKVLDEVVDGVTNPKSHSAMMKSIARQIAAAVAAERERCAKVADEKARTANPKYSQADYALSIAADIRALR